MPRSGGKALRDRQRHPVPSEVHAELACVQRMHLPIAALKPVRVAVVAQRRVAEIHHLVALDAGAGVLDELQALSSARLESATSMTSSASSPVGLA